LPVTAKIELVTAGAMADVPASLISPDGYELSMMWTSIVGASSMRRNLLDTFVFEGDLAMERCREAKDNRALDLRLNVG
jgi:hypothetical protein